MWKSIVAVLVAIAIGVAIGFYIESTRRVEPETIVIEKTDTLIYHDTLRYSYPVPVEVRVVDSIRVPVPVPGKTDTLYLPLPKEQKVYADSTYRAVVSGYEPSLDSIEVYNEKEIINKETTIIVKQQKRWSFTVGPQAGVGITPKGWEPYVGAGITFGYSF